jgi:hypothetical protein
VFLAHKEAVNNVVRHANAGEVKTSLHPRQDGFDLRVEDDAEGFDPSRVPSAGSAQPGRPAGGNGVRNMQARLNDLGGNVSIRSHPGSGTTVSFRIPVQHRNPVALYAHLYGNPSPRGFGRESGSRSAAVVGRCHASRPITQQAVDRQSLFTGAVILFDAGAYASLDALPTP